MKDTFFPTFPGYYKLNYPTMMLASTGILLFSLGPNIITGIVCLPIAAATRHGKSRRKALLDCLKITLPGAGGGLVLTPHPYHGC